MNVLVVRSVWRCNRPTLLNFNLLRILSNWQDFRQAETDLADLTGEASTAASNASAALSEAQGLLSEAQQLEDNASSISIEEINGMHLDCNNLVLQICT